MPDLLHQITIHAPAASVYAALTEQAGLRGWWTTDTVTTGQQGSIAEFGFNKRAMVMKMTLETLLPARRVSWRCIDGPEDWIGTKLEWTLSPLEAGVTKVDFTHCGWKAANEMFALCNSTWGALMYRLKDHAAGAGSRPLFTDPA